MGAGWVSYLGWWRARSGRGEMYIGGLESSLQHGDGVVLGCYVVEILWTTVLPLDSEWDRI